MEENYNKRELDGFHQQINDKLGRIEKQVNMTNGRLSNLEAWRWGLGGGLAVIIFLFPLFLYMYNDRIEVLGKQIDKNTEAIQKR